MVNLTIQQKCLVTISALTATGDMQNLKTHLNASLDAGVTVNEIKEILVQLYAYCGFPRSLNAINMFKIVIDERIGRGIKDIVGKEIIVENYKTDKYEEGRKVLEILTKTPQSKPAQGFGEFVPRIDVFLKEHLFFDIFKSDVLSYKQRELVTISALAAMSGLESQLKSHINMGLNSGLTQSQLAETFNLVKLISEK